MQTHTNTHTDNPHKINFKKPGVPGLKIVALYQTTITVNDDVYIIYFYTGNLLKYDPDFNGPIQGKQRYVGMKNMTQMMPGGQ